MVLPFLSSGMGLDQCRDKNSVKKEPYFYEVKFLAFINE
jgi:hypothetical protein